MVLNKRIKRDYFVPKPLHHKWASFDTKLEEGCYCPEFESIGRFMTINDEKY